METMCPLLEDPDAYSPDTIDLINNVQEREYWLPCLERMVKKFVDKANILNPSKPNATEEAENCFHIFKDLIDKLKSDPELLEPLSVRTLLEFNEQILRDNNFNDAWHLQKEKETDAAFSEFPKRIEFTDSIEDFDERWVELSKGIVAGNMFDWGAKAIADILETSNKFTLVDAMNTIQKRPWFRDDLDRFISKFKERRYKTVVIFVDNAGVDFVLGVLPFAREFVKENAKVILSANTLPALNDITIKELNDCLHKAGSYCPVIRDAVTKNRLVGMENGHGGPCIDLRKLNRDLCNSLQDVDLIILEGMGRAVHTNLNAKFNVDSLKLASLKNEWLAKSLGAEQFSIIFDFKTASTPSST